MGSLKNEMEFSVRYTIAGKNPTSTPRGCSDFSHKKEGVGEIGRLFKKRDGGGGVSLYFHTN